jgi:tetratricopeptide (TPR) repeat protein
MMSSARSAHTARRSGIQRRWSGRNIRRKSSFVTTPRRICASSTTGYALKSWASNIAFRVRTSVSGRTVFGVRVMTSRTVRSSTCFSTFRPLLRVGATRTSPHRERTSPGTRGEAFLGLGRLDQALATAAAALERDRTGVPVEFVVSLHTLLAQALNQRKEFTAARDAAGAAIAAAGDASPIGGFSAFVRLAALMQRSLSLYRLGDVAAAHRDVDAAITGLERLPQGPDFARFETSLWFTKGALLDADSRTDEALAAYTRAQRLERQGNVAAVARGYALARTGAFAAALEAFGGALERAGTDMERAEALAGKGLALVRLRKFEEAVGELHAALDARLTDPDDDPGVFELLGIAYDALQRNGAARRAFRRAWTLTPEGKRTANLARGVTAAELRLSDPKAALDFVDALPESLADQRTLLFNRALALDALGRRRAAINTLVRARDAGLERAQQELDRLDAPAGLGRWTHHWSVGRRARVDASPGASCLPSRPPGSPHRCCSGGSTGRSTGIYCSCRRWWRSCSSRCRA